MNYSRRCPSCPAKYRCVPGDGPLPSRMMALGQNPGKEEEAGGRPFIGRSGQEFNENYLPLAGLSRDSIFVTNAFHCHTSNNRKPTPQEIDSCTSWFLSQELEECNPEILLTMGAVALSAVAPELDLDTHHGIPQLITLYDREQWIYPVYHPASGLHDTSSMTPLLEDFANLSKILSGNYTRLTEFVPRDEFPYTQYREARTPDDVAASFHYGNILIPHTGVDTETILETGSLKRSPWCLTYSNAPGTAWLIRSDNRDALDAYNFWSGSSFFPPITSILHNAGQDLDTLSSMGINIPPNLFTDTMSMSYRLGNLPQGLKPLAYRLCGMTMRDYNDVVMPYSRSNILDWLAAALEISSEHPITISKLVPRKRKGVISHYDEKQLIKPNPLTTPIKRIINHTSKPIIPGKTVYNPWKAWLKLEESERCIVEKEIGLIPAASIAQVPFEEALAYSARDADATLRVYSVLEKRLEKFGSEVSENDWDN
jgi:uracil-DNA glycosylase family 4